MTVIVLFLWISATPVAVHTFHNINDCIAQGEAYKHFACVPVVVPQR